MTSPQNNIPLFAVRTLSEIFNATFDFVRANWRPWLRLSLYLLLPLAVAQGMGLSSMFSRIAEGSDRFWFSLVITAIIAVIALSANVALAITLLRLHDDRPEAVADISVAEIWPSLRKAWWPVVLMVLCSYFIAIVPLILGASLLVFVFPIGLLVIFALLPLLLWPSAYLIEGKGFFHSFVDAFSAGYSHWGRLIGLGFTMGITVFVLQQATWIPWFLSVFFYGNFISDTSSLVSVGWWRVVIDALFTLITIIHCFASYLSMAFIVMAMTYFYTSQLTADGRMSITDRDIDNFENL